MLTQFQIDFLNNVCRNRWTLRNGIISVEGNVNIFYKKLTQIPVQFGKVNGYFDSQHNNITTLINGPKEVEGYYSCVDNKLIDLTGAPEICNANFYCQENQLTSLKGCPKIITDHLYCWNNPDLEYLWGIGCVKGHVYYDNKNEINKWIIECARKDIIFPYFTLEDNINWIKREQKYSILLGAPEEIRQHFAPRIIHLVDMGTYNESRILDYKKFRKLC